MEFIKKEEEEDVKMTFLLSPSHEQDEEFDEKPVITQADPSAASTSHSELPEWKEDEPLGHQAKKAPVLYANVRHPELKEKYPEWNERVKHIQRFWRTLDSESRSVFVNKARENRANRGKQPRVRKMDAVSQSNLSSTDRDQYMLLLLRSEALLRQKEVLEQELQMMRKQKKRDVKTLKRKANGNDVRTEELDELLNRIILKASDLDKCKQEIKQHSAAVSDFETKHITRTTPAPEHEQLQTSPPMAKKMKTEATLI